MVNVQEVAMKRYDRSILSALISEMQDIVEAERNDGDEWGLARAEWLMQLATFIDRRLEELYEDAGADTFDDGPLLDWDLPPAEDRPPA
jgi:hypothetical protein